METLEKNFKKEKSVFSAAKKKKNLSFSKNEKTTTLKDALQAGDILTVKITALGSKNIGVAELKNGYTVLVPNTKCGDKVQVKVEKIFLGKGTNSILNQKIKYVVACVDNSGTKTSNFEKTSNSLKFDFKVGQKFRVTIAKKGPKNSGLVPVAKNFLFIVPNTKVGENIVVEIQKIKQNYAFAKPILSKQMNVVQENNQMIGQQFHIVIPSSAKTIANSFVVKLNGQFVFVKKSLGVQLEDTVKIQIQKSTGTFALAKILKISPISSKEKKAMVKETVQKMIQSSMHFGEKAIRCNANMRKYIWYRKKGLGMYTNSKNTFVSIKETKKPMVKRGRHVLNVLKTQRCFAEALKQLAKYAAKGKTFLFVGTKKPAASLVAKTALLSNTSFFVNTRWLGGMLTNWKTILKSISQIRPILKQKQKILQKILEKREKIQRRLFNKVYLLRKKSQKFMIKGKYLIQQILRSKNFLIEKSQKFIQTKNALFSANALLLNASKNLKMKKIQILKQIQQLEFAAVEILKQKQQLKVLIQSNLKKFNEIRQFFEIGQQLLKTKDFVEKNKNTTVVTLSYEKLLTVQNSTGGDNLQVTATLPNPSPEIFKKMIAIVSNLRKEENGFFATNQMGTSSNRAKSTDTPAVSTSQNVGGANEPKTILISKFLNKFILLLPFFKNSLQTLSDRLVQQEKMLKELNSTFTKITESQKSLKQLYKKTISQYAVVSSKFIVQQNNFKKFQKNLKQFASEQRLLKFLPKLRYLPTSQTKMYEIVELFMKKFVDPKLSYPMEQIYDQKLKFTSKKIAATRKQKWQRLEKYFGGITKMAKMNTKQISKNVAIIIGQQEEMNAVHECRKLGMKIFAVVDTNCNPKFVDHIIPANDDSRNSIKYILGEMLTYIRLGQKLRKKVSLRAKIQQNRKKRFAY
uniref:Small ribosomal subunit protein uS2c n=1 Tax=Tetradesmus obliquus TaxID=3088 RepID=A0A249RWU4_TETOB|nr:30S ribosomal protein S2 [Tetradesmus obliquus]